MMGVHRKGASLLEVRLALWWGACSGVRRKRGVGDVWGGAGAASGGWCWKERSLKAAGCVRGRESAARCWVNAGVRGDVRRGLVLFVPTGAEHWVWGRAQRSSVPCHGFAKQRGAQRGCCVGGRRQL